MIVVVDRSLIMSKTQRHAVLINQLKKVRQAGPYLFV